jgi:putative membrane protein
MINRYNELSANERTYLAWLRTSLALLAFGFMLERFDLFLKMFAKVGSPDGKIFTGPLGREVGVALIVMGLLAIGLSTRRYVATVQRIRSDGEYAYDLRIPVAVGVAFLLLALLLLLYVIRVWTPA